MFVKMKMIMESIASRLLSRRLTLMLQNYFDKRFQKEIKMYEGDNLRRYKRFERLADKAEKKDQYAAAINAEYRSGQLAGAFIDRKEVKVTGLEGMSREELENKLSELSQKIDGYNAKTIEAEPEHVEEIETASWSEWIKVFNKVHNPTMFTSIGKVKVVDD